MNNKIEITKVLKNSDEYTEEELKSGKLYQVGLEYNGKIYYFSKPVGVCKDLALVFNTFGEDPDYPAKDSIKALYEEHRKAFNEINMDYQTNSSDTQTIFTKVKNNEINYTKKEEKDVIKVIKNKSINNSNNVKKQEAQQTRVQNTSSERKFYNVWLNDNVCQYKYRNSSYESYHYYENTFENIIRYEYEEVYIQHSWFFGDYKVPKVFEKYEKCMVIAELKNGTFYDVITEEPIYYIEMIDNPDLDKYYNSIKYHVKTLHVDGITCFKYKSISKADVVELLSHLKSDDISRYKKSIETVKKYKKDSQKNFFQKVREGEEEERKKREDKLRTEEIVNNKFDSFMDDFRKRNR